jgi:hypothetical protein
VIKILKTDLEGKIILTEEDLDELLDDAFIDGYNSCMIDYDLEETEDCDCCDKYFTSNESYYEGFDDGYTTCLNTTEELLQEEYRKGFTDGMNESLKNTINVVDKETTKRDNNSEPLTDLFEHWLTTLLDDLKNESK